MERRRCEFFLVRYVPDPVKNEFVNIGILLREAAPSEGGSGGETVVRFTRNWSRVRCVDPDADISMLEALEGDIRRRLDEPGEGVRPVVAELEDSVSNQVRLTPMKGCLAENLVTETEQLMRLFVEPRKREAVPRRSGRQAIYASMRSQFERAGVWDFMDKRIAVTRYIDGADTLRIDCGYQNGKVRMFQAVSLDDIDVAKVLAFTAPALSEGVLRVSGLELELTAIGEPLRRVGTDGALEKNSDQLALYESGRRIMEKAEIRFMTTSDLPRIAETARLELKV